METESLVDEDGLRLWPQSWHVPEKTLNSFDAEPLKSLGTCSAFSVPEASSPVTLNCYFLGGQAPPDPSKGAREIPSVPGCAPTTPDPEGGLPSSSPQPHHPEEAPMAILPVDMSPVHQCGLDRPAGPLGAETAPSPANPESGGQSRKRKKRGTEEIAGVSQTTTPSNLNSREFISNMKKPDKRARMWAFRGRVTGLPRLTWWLLLITSCHTEKNPLTAPDRPRPSPAVCAHPQDSPPGGTLACTMDSGNDACRPAHCHTGTNASDADADGGKAVQGGDGVCGNFCAFLSVLP